IVPSFVVAILWQFMWQSDVGIVNKVLVDYTGILGHRPIWLLGPNTMWAIVIPSVWRGLPFAMLIFLAGLQAVPQDLLEAAQIDGCSRRAAFWRIQVPLLRPVSGFLLVWLTINALQLFDEVYATTKGGPLHSSTVIVYYLYQQAFQFFHAGYAAAIAVVLFAAIAVITVIQLRMTRGVADDGRRSR
ncbi:MAG TPA: sugar ABC transporter permease, partial [Pseudonocardiaceae bacterium]|nr:sugar ABC transporter permease [Pseudonocardiaceae bacterium]